MLGLGTIGQFAIGEQSLTSAQAEIITVDKWFIPFTDPVRFKPGLKAAHQVPLAFHSTPVVSFGWMAALSEPVRKKPINPAALTPFFFMQPAPSPFVATGWYMPLSEPVRFKRRLIEAIQQAVAYQANPLTVTPFAWFAPLSEPVRQKIGLKAHLQRADTINPSFIPAPATLIEGWFNWLSEPVRQKVGLRVYLQPSYTAPTRLLPNPNVTIILNTTEINSDQATFAVNVINSKSVVSARVSLVEIGNGLSPTAIVEH